MTLHVLLCFGIWLKMVWNSGLWVETVENVPTLGRSKWVVISEFGGGRFAVRSVNSGSTTRLEWRGWPTGVRGPKVRKRRKVS